MTSRSDLAAHVERVQLQLDHLVHAINDYTSAVDHALRRGLVADAVWDGSDDG